MCTGATVAPAAALLLRRQLDSTLQTADGERRNRFLYVAIDRCSRWVHLAVYNDGLTTSAVSFLNEAVGAFPFKITHALTDRGSCFTADGFEAACRRLKLEHRKTKPYTPQTNGLVERFNGRVQREVLGITIYSHRDLETLLKGFNQAYNRRRQRVLKGASPEQVVHRRLAAEPKLANQRYKPPDSDALPPALRVVAHAKEVSHLDAGAAPYPGSGNQLSKIDEAHARALTVRRVAMEHYVGLDVSLKLTAICIVDQTGKIVREGMVSSDPEAIAGFVQSHAPHVARVGLETGATATWLWNELNALGLPVICIDARHAKAALKMQSNKNDRNDAAGIARIMQCGWYKQVHVKDRGSPANPREARSLPGRRRW